ncbi:Nucleolar complex protein 2 homolog [Eumeta japonica]|uniref:Nucleolar complex protein 2 homolog n=1 Tax=Eumeta variegata TaxID=151549 RepID=A0A4C1YQK2_EUMVA|nr:Nucleolar complex protein 2 homolog [Eumeta japonica]
MGKQNTSDSEDELNPANHKQDLQKLKEIDPDFYSFLEENDEKLLDFNIESENSEAEDEDDSVHVPGVLKADSDESDFEEEGGKPMANYKVTLKMVSEWQTNLQNENKISLNTLVNVLKAFNAAMLRVTTEDGNEAATYKVEGSSVFNAVIQLCVLYLPPALKKYLRLDQSGKDPRKCKHFVKIKHPLISYLNDLMKLLGGVTSTNILTVLLKHLHQMSVYVACFGRISRLLLKKLIPLWSSGEETVRVLAFLCILRIMRNQQATLLNPVLKAMYLTYVKNCKFIRQFLKTCAISNYTKKLRQLLEKIEENSKFIENERSKISFSLSDNKLISAWELNIKNRGTPLSKFFESWNKISRIQKRKKITNNDDLAEELPLIKRPKRNEAHELQKDKGAVVLFPSDSEDEKDEFVFGGTEKESKKENSTKKLKKVKKGKKKKAVQNTVTEIDDYINDEPDLVQDFSAKDW